MGQRSATVVEVASLEGWREQWDELVLAAPLPSPFMRSWWVESVSRAVPIFVLVVDGTKLLGGLALERRPVGPFGYWTHPGPGGLTADHIDLVARPDAVDDVCTHMRGWGSRRGGVLLDLTGMRQGAALARPFEGRVTRSLDVVPYLPLPATVEAFRAGFGRQFLKSIRKHARRLQADGLTHRVVEADDVDRALADLRRLHLARWGAKSGFLPVFEEFSRAARAGVARGEVRFHEYAADTRVVAANVVFVTGRRTSVYQGGRLDDHHLRGSGTVLMMRLIEHAIESGAEEFDFLRGAERYKADFARHMRLVERRIAWLGASPRVGALLWDLGLDARAHGEWVARRMLRRKGARSGQEAGEAVPA